MRKRRILALVHEDLVPPKEAVSEAERNAAAWRMEHDVVHALEGLGHEVRTLGVSDELAPIRVALGDFEPHVVFNLLEEFHGLAVYDQHVVSYLELMRQAYTGCNPRGLVLARDKALSKKILSYHRLPVPTFHTFPRGRKTRRPARLEFPLIVKSLIEESSTGIAQASVVQDDESLAERVRLVHERLGTDAIVERYVEGRELYVSVLGNHRLQVLPTWELVFEKAAPGAPLIVTERAKHDLSYQEKIGVKARAAEDLDEAAERALVRASRRIYRVLGLSGYARLDFRLAPDDRFFFLEANPNPDISRDEELAMAAAAIGMTYEGLIQRIVSLGLRASRGR